MFTVKRRTASLIVDRNIVTQTFEYDNLLDALNHLQDLKKVDKARYEALKRKYPEMFADDNSNTFSYWYTIGYCTISCEVEGVLKNAEQEFYVKCQLMTTQNCKGVNNNEKEN